MPSVSVVIPVHNVAKYLEQTVRSVLGQTFADIEVILAENLSTDGSAELCERLCSEDSRVRMIRLDVAGLSHARNAGIEASAAEYICFFDGDDTVDPDMISSMYGAVTGYGADLATCNYVIEYPDRAPEYRYREDGSVTYYSREQMLEKLLSEEICSSACTMLFRKSLFADIRFPENRYFEDHATTYRVVASAAGGGVHFGRSFYHYLQRTGSICNSMDVVKFYDFAIANAERLDFIEGTALLGDQDRKRLLERHVEMFMNNFMSALARSSSPDDRKMMDVLASFSSKLLSYGVASGKNRSRLIRIRWMWPLFYRKHSGTAR